MRLSSRWLLGVLLLSVVTGCNIVDISSKEDDDKNSARPPVVMNKLIDTFPDWSPDGERIAVNVVSDDSLTSGIWTVGSDGEEPREIVTDAVNPAWSPDGEHIAYHGWFLEEYEHPTGTL